jgi:hypothetical protein
MDTCYKEFLAILQLLLILKSNVCVRNETEDKVSAAATEGRWWTCSSHILELVLR